MIRWKIGTVANVLKFVRRSVEDQRNIHYVIKVKANWCCSDQLCKIKKRVSYKSPIESLSIDIQ
jgi:hypothetical protein